MHRVANNTSNSSYSQNFLKLERNTVKQLLIRDNQLLERVLNKYQLSDKFLKDVELDNLRQQPTIVQRYKTKVEEFLKSLLLLIYITIRQLEKEIEVISLQYINTISSYYYNFFANYRIINIVTTYYKSYNIIDSIKIIYYLQLILLFY